jgi:uncharacterized protein YdeI (YjbR/CyaY-like superfamily)
VVADAGEWRAWLSGQHAESQGVWLVLAKKGTTRLTTLSYDEALEEALCFGWIDGQLGRRDPTTFRRCFTPRKARSPWSQRNAAIVERLTTSGRMHRSGENEVQQAREDGRWDAAYAGQASMEVPEDLADALIADPRAQAMFETLTSANRYSILFRIGSAKKAETRAKRIEQFVEMLTRGETIHPRLHDHLISESASLSRSLGSAERSRTDRSGSWLPEATISRPESAFCPCHVPPPCPVNDPLRTPGHCPEE